MPLKVIDDYYDDLQEEKIEEYSEKYMLKDSVVRDIFLEGWDLCCAFYENKTGKVKQSIIREQYPELFENQTELDVVNEATLIDRIGYAQYNFNNNELTQKEAKEWFEENKEELQKILIKDNYYQYHKDMILKGLEVAIKDIIEGEERNDE